MKECLRTGHRQNLIDGYDLTDFNARGQWEAYNRCEHLCPLSRPSFPAVRLLMCELVLDPSQHPIS